MARLATFQLDGESSMDTVTGMAVAGTPVRQEESGLGEQPDGQVM
jgi:hypothetical protein